NHRPPATRRTRAGQGPRTEARLPPRAEAGALCARSLPAASGPSRPLQPDPALSPARRLESGPLHLAPAAPPAEEIPERLALEHGEQLPVAEVLRDPEQEQLEQVVPGRIAAEGDLLQQDRRDGEENAVQDGEAEEEQEKLHVQDAEPPRQQDRHVARDL